MAVCQPMVPHQILKSQAGKTSVRSASGLPDLIGAGIRSPMSN